MPLEAGGAALLEVSRRDSGDVAGGLGAAEPAEAPHGRRSGGLLGRHMTPPGCSSKLSRSTTVRSSSRVGGSWRGCPPVISAELQRPPSWLYWANIATYAVSSAASWDSRVGRSGPSSDTSMGMSQVISQTVAESHLIDHDRGQRVTWTPGPIDRALEGWAGTAKPV